MSEPTYPASYPEPSRTHGAERGPVLYSQGTRLYLDHSKEIPLDQAEGKRCTRTR